MSELLEGNLGDISVLFFLRGTWEGVSVLSLLWEWQAQIAVSVKTAGPCPIECFGVPIILMYFLRTSLCYVELCVGMCVCVWVRACECRCLPRPAAWNSLELEQ